MHKSCDLRSELVSAKKLKTPISYFKQGCKGHSINWKEE